MKRCLLELQVRRAFEQSLLLATHCLSLQTSSYLLAAQFGPLWTLRLEA